MSQLDYYKIEIIYYDSNNFIWKHMQYKLDKMIYFAIIESGKVNIDQKEGEFIINPEEILNIEMLSIGDLLTEEEIKKNNFCMTQIFKIKQENKVKLIQERKHSISISKNTLCALEAEFGEGTAVPFNPATDETAVSLDPAIAVPAVDELKQDNIINSDNFDNLFYNQESSTGHSPLLLISLYESKYTYFVFDPMNINHERDIYWINDIVSKYTIGDYYTVQTCIENMTQSEWSTNHITLSNNPIVYQAIHETAHDLLTKRFQKIYYINLLTKRQIEFNTCIRFLLPNSLYYAQLNKQGDIINWFETWSTRFQIRFPNVVYQMDGLQDKFKQAFCTSFLAFLVLEFFDDIDNIRKNNTHIQWCYPLTGTHTHEYILYLFFYLFSIQDGYQKQDIEYIFSIIQKKVNYYCEIKGGVVFDQEFIDYYYNKWIEDVCLKRTILKFDEQKQVYVKNIS